MIDSIQNDNDLILVTSTSNYIASHIAYFLLINNYRVRVIVSFHTDKEKYFFPFKLKPEKKQNFEIIEIDPKNKQSWIASTKGCKYVCIIPNESEIMSPIDKTDMIQANINYILNILNSCIVNNVQRVVITSPINNMIIGNQNILINEEHWTAEVEVDCPISEKYKLVTEKAIWEFFQQNKNKIEIVTIHPGLMLGPALSKDLIGSNNIFLKILKEEIAGYPITTVPVVDVRDVAIAHLKALKLKEANGRRYIVASQNASIKELVDMLRDELGSYGYNLVNRPVSRWSIKLISYLDSSLKKLLPYAGRDFKVDNARSIRELKVRYRSIEETITDMGYNFIELGLVPDRVNKIKKI